MWNLFKKVLISVAIPLFVATQCFAVTSVQDDGTYEGDYTTINFSTGMSGAQSSTDPSVYDVTGGPIGSDGNWTGDGTTTTLDAAPTKFIATHSSGEFMATVLDTDDITGTTNAQTIDFGTDTEIILGDNSDTLAFDFTGDDVSINPSDGGIIFNTTASDATGTFDFCARTDTDDCLVLDTITNVPTIATRGTSNLTIIPDGGTVAVDAILTVSGTQSFTGATTATSIIIGDDTIDVVVDDQMRFASNDEESTIEAYGFESKSAVLQLTSDEGDAAGDTWQLVSDHGSSNLLITNDITVEDTHATVFTISTVGVVTSTGDIIAVNDSATTDAVQDVLQMSSSSTGTAAAGLGAGFTADIENGAGEVEERFALDIVATDVTNGAENADVVMELMQIGTSREVFRIDTDVTATANTTFELTAWTIQTDGVQDVLELKLDNTADTATDGLGLGISILMEDETGVEQRASIDFVQTDAARATNDTDIVISQDVAGTITETARFNADGGTLELTVAAPYLAIQSTNTSNGDALIQLRADAAADAGDIWEIEHDGATNDLLFQNDTGSKDTAQTVFTIAETGAVTATYYITTKYYTTADFPGSGAPVGSIITIGGEAGNCGGVLEGTVVNVCVSNGTNWIAV